MVVPHGLSVRLGCRAHQEHLLVLAVQTLSGKTRQEKSHHRGGACRSPITDGVKLPVINALYGAITVDKEIDLEEA